MRFTPSLRVLRPVLLALAFGLAVGPPPARAGDDTLTCETLPKLVNEFLRHHVLYHEIDDPLRGRVVDAYLQRIDPLRSLYLDGEAKALMAGLRDGFDDILAGDCGRIERIQSDVVVRTRAMEEFVRAEAARPDLALDPTRTVASDPKKRGFPRTKDDREQLYRTLVQFQIADYLNAGLSMEEAKSQLVHRYEVNTKQTVEQTPADLRGAFLDAFATALDPHTNYLPPDDAEDFDIQMGLSLEGIGLELSSKNGYAVVEGVVPGGAADRQGVMRRKDKIVAVAQEGGELVRVIDMKLRDVVRMIRGRKGTPVRLTVVRPADPPERFDVTIVRDKIDLEEQAAKLRFETIERSGKPLKLAVLELPGFYGDRDPTKRQAERDVRQLLQQVRDGKADGLVFDLSRNGGGLLEYAISISGFFLRSGGVVAVKPENQPPRVLPDPDESIVYSGPLVVLISRVTASASEILAGALQDYHRAVVVGDDQTFGKGTVQQVAPLGPQLGKMKVTTALFFRPGGASTQLAGVKADVTMPSYSNVDDFGEGALPFALPTQHIPPFLRDEANNGFTPWQPVTSSVVADLQERAKKRIDASAEFGEIREKVAKVREQAGRVELAEVMKAKEKGETDDDEDERGPNRKPSPQQLEAVQILADYVELQRASLASTAAN